MSGRGNLAELVEHPPGIHVIDQAQSRLKLDWQWHAARLVGIAGLVWKYDIYDFRWSARVMQPETVLEK